jgi:hypothetical protein
MKTFEVSIWTERGYAVTVQANTEEEAEEKALENYVSDGTNENIIYSKVVHGDSGVCQTTEVTSPRTKIPDLNDEGKFVRHEGEAS